MLCLGNGKENHSYNRIDDIVLLLNVMMQMGLPTLLNQHLPRHWKQQDWTGMGGDHLAIVHPLGRTTVKSG